MKKNSLKKNEVCKLHPWEEIPCKECRLKNADKPLPKKKIVFDRKKDDVEYFDMFADEDEGKEDE